MDSSIPSTFHVLFLNFKSLFTSRSFDNFVTLVTGWICCTGRHSISRVILAGLGRARRKHHSALYRFFSRASWLMDDLARVLLPLILDHILGEWVYVIVDDTLSRRSGPHLFGACMHHDPLRSTYGRGTRAGRQVFFAFGHNWVILSIWIPLPWSADRGFALPLLFRLYRSKKRCPKKQYRKRTELATELVQTLNSYLPAERRVMVVTDSEYACETLVRSLPPGVHFTGPMNMNAALYRPPQPRRGRGRPRVRGTRLPSPSQLARRKSARWTVVTPHIYGQEVDIQVKTQTALWYTVAKDRPVRLVVTRDPKGRIEDRAYFTTHAEMSVEEILQTFAKRWTIEVTFRSAKQSLGIQEPQNGWWRRRSGGRRPAKKAGPQPNGNRGSKAVERTFPFALVNYTLVVLWYLRHGNPARDIREVRRLQPWYRQKTQPSFADMLRAARRELWTQRFLKVPGLNLLPAGIRKLLPEWLLAG